MIEVQTFPILMSKFHVDASVYKILRHFSLLAALATPRPLSLSAPHLALIAVKPPKQDRVQNERVSSSGSLVQVLLTAARFCTSGE